MIAKITRGKDFDGLGRYLYSVGENHEAHLDPRAIAGGSVMIDDSRQWRPWAADMAWCAEHKPRVANPVWHCSLRAAPEDEHLADHEWAAIAEQHIAQMGLAEHPWVAVRHGADHVHIVASRVDASGKLWRDSHDKLRAMRSCRAIEREHGLVVVDEHHRSGDAAMVTASERARAARRTGTAGRDVQPERLRLRQLVHDAADAARRGVEDFGHQLYERGVLYKANHDATRRVRGYSFSLPGWTAAGDGTQVWIKASEVDRALAWTKLKPRIGADRPGADQVRRRPARAAAEAFPTLADREIARAIEAGKTADTWDTPGRRPPHTPDRGPNHGRRR